ncbi:hypothetical protein RclHR1_01100005 [Rhizophagus clarus]|nr:hypothetical protein RclHR1_01100005 [Rhizophagus clarus]
MKEGASTRDSDDFEQYLDAQENIERSMTPENPPSTSKVIRTITIQESIDFDTIYKKVAAKEMEQRKNQQT